MDVALEPGFGHDFHKHPEQDEMIIVKAGKIEQWIGEENTVLEAGDSVYLDKDVVHASFNVGDVTAHLQVILAPSRGRRGLPARRRRRRAALGLAALSNSDSEPLRIAGPLRIAHRGYAAKRP